MTTQERYQNAFDAIKTDADINVDTLKARKKQLGKKRLRTAVCSFAVFAVMFLGSNAISYAKTGEFWVSELMNFKTENGINVKIQSYTDGADGTENTEFDVQFDVVTDGQDPDDYCKVENGRIYFTCGDIKEDITDKVSKEDYYKYEYTDSDSMKHVIVAGGTADMPGWAEYIFDKEGKLFFNSASVNGDYYEIAMNVDDFSQGTVAVTCDKDKASTGEEEVSEKYYMNIEEDNTVKDADSGEIMQAASQDDPAWLTKAKADLGISE